MRLQKSAPRLSSQDIQGNIAGRGSPPAKLVQIGEVPLLSLQHIDQLSAMVRGIQNENRKQLEEILSSMVSIEHTSIINLYNLAVEEWHSKQRTIDNLCHFTLSMMNTIQLLWEKKYEHEDKISSAEIIIDSLERNLGELNQQNQNIKVKIDEAQAQISNINYEKDRIEELYRSSSCIAFQKQSRFGQPQQLVKKCSACFDTQSQCDQQKNQYKKLSSKLLQQKEDEISSLREENRRLEEEFEELKEEQQLSKIQMELAEIAVQEALVYKSSYISMMSSINEENPQRYRLEHIEKSNPKNEQTSLQNQDLCPLNSHLLAFQIPKNQEPDKFIEHHYMDSKEEDSCELSLVKLDTKAEEKDTTNPSPFRKKGNNCLQSQYQQHQDSFQQSTIHNKESDVVIFQSNIDFTISSATSNSKQRQTSYSDIDPSRTLHPLRDLFRSRQKIKPIKMKKPSMPNHSQEVDHRSSPFLRPHPYIPSERNTNPKINESQDSETSQHTINKLFNYLSSKVIKNRIRRRK